MNIAMILDIPASIAAEDVVLIEHGEPVSYETLRERAGRVAGLLSRLGVAQTDRVGLFATNSVAYVEALFGAAILGATVVPMNFRARAEEAGHLMADSGSRVVFAETRYRKLVDEVRPDTVEHVIFLDDGYAAERDASQEVEDIAFLEDEQLAALLYTSGTTALPKGVMLTHGALSGYVLGSAEAADGTDHGRMLLAAPLYHIAGLTSLLMSVYSGRATIVLPQFDAGAWLDAVERDKATHAFLVPTMLARLLEYPELPARDLSSLELVTYGAAPMPQPVIRRALELFPKGVSFSQAYGQTETTSTVTVLGPEDHDLEGPPEEVERKLKRLGSVGRPVDDVELRVVDALGQPLPAGGVGEVQLRTPRTMDGYWGSEEKTRVTVDDEGWVHTGDLGYIDEDGYLFLSGRSTDMIIRGGENIAPEEVEAVLYEHPDVLEAAVVGVPDEDWGERVMGAVVLRPGSGTAEQALIAHCAEHLAASKRPERILILEQLPRTSTGKLMRRDLRPVIEQTVR